MSYSTILKYIVKGKCWTFPLISCPNVMSIFQNVLFSQNPDLKILNSWHCHDTTRFFAFNNYVAFKKLLKYFSEIRHYIFFSQMALYSRKEKT